MKNQLVVLFICFGFGFAQAQFSRKDSLQGGLRVERTSFDVLRYDLNITINPDEKEISGYNDITFKAVNPTKKIQLDLFDNMKIDEISNQNFGKLEYVREENAVFVQFPSSLIQDSVYTIRFMYHGNPKIAKNAPWDGGFVFKKDSNGKDFIGVAVQGTGASLWYPVKDSQSDEPDFGASVKVAVPNGLMNVSNGRFQGSTDLGNGYTRWDWEVKNPINTYSITVNVADYVHFSDSLPNLDIDYYVLRENAEKAKIHFDADVKPMMNCFQSKFGIYPFAEDGFKLVESPYLGMEHQSAVAYGNKYRKGYLGSDLSGTGVGMFFDYIIIHETGHEWFGNSITSQDIADMWIHEGFTTYTETVFVECMKGYEAALKYVNGQARNVRNDKPIIGKYGVNSRGSGDMYYKGSLLLNTLRHVINDDTKWWQLLYNYSEHFKKQIITTEMVIAYFNEQTNMDLTPIFKQYLYTANIPALEYKKIGTELQYQWKNVNSDFNMPVDIAFGKEIVRLYPTTQKQKIKLKNFKKSKSFEIFDNRFFINVIEAD
ncbi:M1 family metallopeptidase [Flavobacterium tibetense]|uniref:M1 family peptidase n=1 Tax=Flavobacterium tibetense TaxID=2233533 RepID=A0A365P233_9FLAO|nr:M1 family metallopeptidase [Flavobacterium tibetense]RBA28598.1 M1 family peptidase [Flavobacterium tibetense]